MIDFDKLVLRAGQSTFARPITIEPIVSQPGAPVYSLQADGISPLRGIWTEQNIDVALEEGIMSSRVRTLDIRLIEFAIPLMQGDKVTVSGVTSPVHIIDDVDEDGQGAAKLTLKIVPAQKPIQAQRVS